MALQFLPCCRRSGFARRLKGNSQFGKHLLELRRRVGLDGYRPQRHIALEEQLLWFLGPRVLGKPLNVQQCQDDAADKRGVSHVTSSAPCGWDL